MTMYYLSPSRSVPSIQSSLLSFTCLFLMPCRTKRLCRYLYTTSRSLGSRCADHPKAACGRSSTRRSCRILCTHTQPMLSAPIVIFTTIFTPSLSEETTAVRTAARIEVCRFVLVGKNMNQDRRSRIDGSWNMDLVSVHSGPDPQDSTSYMSRVACPWGCTALGPGYSVPHNTATYGP